MSDDKLYAVEVKTTIMVVAVNEMEAEEIAKDTLQGEIPKEDMETSAEDVEYVSDIARHGWSAQDMPFGQSDCPDEQKTCEEWVELIQKRGELGDDTD